MSLIAAGNVRLESNFALKPTFERVIISVVFAGGVWFIRRGGRFSGELPFRWRKVRKKKDAAIN